MSNTVSTKTTSTLFLAIVLVTGTIAAISPTFIIKGVNAQGEPYYSGMDNSYDDKKSYGMDDSYGASDYGMDNDRKSYDNSYKSQYQSYKSDYKPVKDDKRDKFKDSKVDIKKLKCININVNINGNNTGDVNLGNKDGVAADAEEGYLGTYSSGGSGYSGEGYYDGYSKKDNGFDCIINNNNTNINTVGGGNQTEPLTCEECFTENLSPRQLNNLTSVLSSSLLRDLEGLCEFLSNPTLTNQQKLFTLSGIFINAGITIETDADTILRVLKCLDELGLIIAPPNLGLPNSMR